MIVLLIGLRLVLESSAWTAAARSPEMRDDGVRERCTAFSAWSRVDSRIFCGIVCPGLRAASAWARCAISCWAARRARIASLASWRKRPERAWVTARETGAGATAGRFCISFARSAETALEERLTIFGGRRSLLVQAGIPGLAVCRLDRDQLGGVFVVNLFKFPVRAIGIGKFVLVGGVL